MAPYRRSFAGVDAWRLHMALAQVLRRSLSIEPADVDLAELYFERGWTDGLPVVPPTRDKVDAVVQTLGGNPDFVECKVAPPGARLPAKSWPSISLWRAANPN